MTKWEPEKHKSLGVQVERFMGHVATDGSLDKKDWRGACGWAVVHLDYDEEIRPMYGMNGSMEEELEIHRTIKRAERTAFVCLLKKVIGPNKGTVDGITKRRECIKPRAGGADLWLKN